MGRRIYLSDNEVRVLNEALAKWENWVGNAWESNQDSMTEWEQRALHSLNHKLYEREEN